MKKISDLVSHYSTLYIYLEAAFDICNILYYSLSFSSLASIREVVKTCSFGQMRLVHSCHVQSRGCWRLNVICMLVGRWRTTTTDKEGGCFWKPRLCVSCIVLRSSSFPFACLEAISEAAVLHQGQAPFVVLTWTNLETHTVVPSYTNTYNGGRTIQSYPEIVMTRSKRRHAQ